MPQSSVCHADLPQRGASNGGHKESAQVESFLVTCARPEIRRDMRFVEEKILPENLSRRLSRELFRPDLEVFLCEISAGCCRKSDNRSGLAILFRCCRKNEDSKFQQADASDVIDLAYRLCLACEFLNRGDGVASDLFLPLDKPHALIRSLTEYSRDYILTLDRNDDEIDSVEGNLILEKCFLEWCDKTAPLLIFSLSSFLNALFTLEDKKSHRFSFPQLNHDSTILNNSMYSPTMFTCGVMSPSLCGKWHRLFTASHDGLSFPTLLKSLLGYSGPTLLLVSSTKGGTFGAFSSTAWKESKDFYGNDDNFLYQLQPTAHLFPTKQSTKAKQNYQYCNPKSRSNGNDKQLHGIGFGGSLKQFRLFLTETLEDCVATTGDGTYEPGLILPSEDGVNDKYFDVNDLEVWCVGGEEVVNAALTARGKQRDIMDSRLAQARRVDKTAFLDDFRSGLIESKAFQHQQQINRNVDLPVDQ